MYLWNSIAPCSSWMNVIYNSQDFFVYHNCASTVRERWCQKIFYTRVIIWWIAGYYCISTTVSFRRACEIWGYYNRKSWCILWGDCLLDWYYCYFCNCSLSMQCIIKPYTVAYEAVNQGVSRHRMNWSTIYTSLWQIMQPPTQVQFMAFLSISA